MTLCFPTDTTLHALLAHSTCRWVLFAPVGEALRLLWQGIAFLPKDSRLVGASVLQANFLSSDSNDSKQGTILVYAKDATKWFGDFLVRRLCYASRFGFLECQSHDGRRLLKVHAPLCARADYMRDTPTKSMRFRVTNAKGFALHLGAQFDAVTQTWVAPNKSVWDKMIVYFEQEPDATVMEWEPQVLDPSAVFTIYSLNVRHDAENTDERMLCLFVSIQSLLPDLVCLQEVTVQALDVLRPLMQTLDYVTFSNVFGKMFGECLFVRTHSLRAEHFDQTPLQPTSTGSREVHLARVRCRRTDRAFYCATCHLETGQKGHELRKAQLSRLLETMPRPFVLAGDLNLSAYDTYVPPLLQTHGVVDAWVACGADFTNAHTWDARQNTQLATSNYCSAPKKRFDRVLMSETGLQPLEFRLVAREQVPLLNTHISDHFGVMCRFQLTGTVGTTRSSPTTAPPPTQMQT